MMLPRQALNEPHGGSLFQHDDQQPAHRFGHLAAILLGLGLAGHIWIKPFVQTALRNPDQFGEPFATRCDRFECLHRPFQEFPLLPRLFQQPLVTSGNRWLLQAQLRRWLRRRAIPDLARSRPRCRDGSLRNHGKLSCFYPRYCILVAEKQCGFHAFEIDLVVHGATKLPFGVSDMRGAWYGKPPWLAVLALCCYAIFLLAISLPRCLTIGRHRGLIDGCGLSELRADGAGTSTSISPCDFAFREF